MKKVLLYLWQLPQNVLGLLVILVTGAQKTAFKSEWIASKWPHFGVSLGNYIIFGGAGGSVDSIRHELGHQKQSQYLGPLYLILIGIPSLLWNFITRILWTFSTKKGAWLGILIIVYYHMPWEYTADKLGGVKEIMMNKYAVYGIVNMDITVIAGTIETKGLTLRETFNLASQIFVYPEGIYIRRIYDSEM